MFRIYPNSMGSWALRILVCFLLVVGSPLQTLAKQQYAPISTNKVPKESRVKVAQEVARVLGVKNVQLSDVHYGSGKEGYYVCAYFHYEGKKIPFSAELHNGARKWRIVRNLNKKKTLVEKMLDREPGRPHYYAGHKVCADNGIFLGRWKNLVNSTPAKVSGWKRALICCTAGSN